LVKGENLGKGWARRPGVEPLSEREQWGGRKEGRKVVPKIFLGKGFGCCRGTLRRGWGRKGVEARISGVKKGPS